MAINLEKINLQKEQVIDLKKKAGIGSRSQAQVVLALDFSGSMTDCMQIKQYKILLKEYYHLD